MNDCRKPTCIKLTHSSSDFIYADRKSDVINSVTDSYSYIVEKEGLPYTADEVFLFINPNPIEGKKMVYISVIKSQIKDLLHELVPYLASQHISFRMVKNKDMAKSILTGKFGLNNLGKVIMMYLSPLQQFEKIVLELAELTSRYKGPDIPGHISLGGQVYSLLNRNGVLPKSNRHLKNKGRIFKNRYVITSQLKQHVKGNVYKGLYFNGRFKIIRCVIKEGKKFMWSDDDGRDMFDRLKWQMQIHNDLAEKIHIPKILDFFEIETNAYLVMEFVKGQTLSHVINSTHRYESWEKLPQSGKLFLLKLLGSVVLTLEKIHNSGYIHRDLTPENFLVTREKQLFMIDLEMAYCKDIKYPLPPFQMGTEGYMSLEQQQANIPTTMEDIYGLGALMIAFFTNKSPTTYNLNEVSSLRTQHLMFSGFFQIDNFVIRCLDFQACNRPSLSEIKNAINNWIDFYSAETTVKTP
jgi:serine/threonine protein kinase